MDHVSPTLPPLPTLDTFATQVATASDEQWMADFARCVARLLNTPDVALFLRDGNGMKPLAALGELPSLVSYGGGDFPRREEESLLFALPGQEEALLWVRTPVEIDAAQAQLEGWLALASLGLARHQQAREMERQRAARDHFFSMVNHDLKGPLSSIKAMADLILRKLQRGTLDPATPEGRADLLERLGFMSQRVKDLAALIDEIGEISYIERGRLQMHQQKVSIGSILRDGIDGILADRDRTIRLEEGDDPLYVRGDSRRLSQLFTNVLKNAASYSEPDTPITVRVMSMDSRVLVEIEDQGPGIEAEQQARLFQEYGHSVQRGSSGLGAGLFIAHALVVAHEGTIALDSTPGKGTTVRVTLPRFEEGASE